VREDTSGEALKDGNFFDKIKQIHLKVHETLKKLQEMYKAQNDQHRIEKIFMVGDKVWLYLNKKRL
jgi:hypothetical protein